MWSKLLLYSVPSLSLWWLLRLLFVNTRDSRRARDCCVATLTRLSSHGNMADSLHLWRVSILFAWFLSSEFRQDLNEITCKWRRLKYFSFTKLIISTCNLEHQSSKDQQCFIQHEFKCLGLLLRNSGFTGSKLGAEDRLPDENTSCSAQSVHEHVDVHSSSALKFSVTYPPELILYICHIF